MEKEQTSKTAEPLNAPQNRTEQDMTDTTRCIPDPGQLNLSPMMHPSAQQTQSTPKTDTEFEVVEDLPAAGVEEQQLIIASLRGMVDGLRARVAADQASLDGLAARAASLAAERDALIADLQACRAAAAFSVAAESAALADLGALIAVHEVAVWGLAAWHRTRGFHPPVSSHHGGRSSLHPASDLSGDLLGAGPTDPEAHNAQAGVDSVRAVGSAQAATQTEPAATESKRCDEAEAADKDSRSLGASCFGGPLAEAGASEREPEAAFWAPQAREGATVAKAIGAGRTARMAAYSPPGLTSWLVAAEMATNAPAQPSLRPSPAKAPEGPPSSAPLDVAPACAALGDGCAGGAARPSAEAEMGSAVSAAVTASSSVAVTSSCAASGEHLRESLLLLCGDLATAASEVAALRQAVADSVAAEREGARRLRAGLAGLAGDARGCRMEVGSVGALLRAATDCIRQPAGEIAEQKEVAEAPPASASSESREASSAQPECRPKTSGARPPQVDSVASCGLAAGGGGREATMEVRFAGLRAGLAEICGAVTSMAEDAAASAAILQAAPVQATAAGVGSCEEARICLLRAQLAGICVDLSGMV